MTDDIAHTLARLAAWAEPRLRADPELRAVVAGLARWVASLAPAEAVVPGGPPAPPPPSEITTPPPAHVVTPPPAVPLSRLPPLRIGSLSPPPITAPHPAAADERDLALLPLSVVADRCRVKAEACRIVSRRLATPGGRRDVAAEDAVSARAAALPDCNLWMLLREPVVTSAKAWHDLAGAFGTAAEAALLLRAWEQSPAPLAERHGPRVLGLTAEAQSVLLYAVADVRDVKVDFDQVQLFAHVRSTARARQVFVPKYLKREDRAAPESWPDVARRVAEEATQFYVVGDRDRNRTKAFNNLKFKLNRLRERPAESAAEWPRTLELVNELVAGGLPPSNSDLRDLLLPLLEDIPDEPPPAANVALVLREIDRYLDTRPDAAPPARQDHLSAEVTEVANLLRGREVVLIGGQARPAHKDALTRAFALADVRWLCTPEHTSFTVFEPDVARPEVALVLLAIRWSNHDYDNVRAYCETYGKPLVRLPGGYNPNQVAHHILAQAGDRLRAARTADG